MLEGTPWKTFEDFCYVIARREYEKTGRFINIDDSAGGDGVEFYLKLPDGDEWGWQAKFFHPDKKLSSSRKNQIKKSLKTAIKKHENLKKWFLCTPQPFSPTGNTWFDEELIEEIPDDKDIELIHWEEGYFHSILSDPSKNGILNYFFGIFEFNLDFFRNNFEEIRELIGRKYLPDLHSNPEVENCILENLTFERLNYLIKTCEKLIDNMNGLIIPVEEPDEFKKYYQDKNWDSLVQDLNTSKSNILAKTEEILVKFKVILEDFHNGEYSVELNDIKFFLNENFKIDYGVLYEFLRVFGEKTSLEFLEKFFSSYNYIYETFYGLFSSTIEIKALAGKGKTQVSCHIAESFIKKDKPVIILLGIQFRNANSLKSQILDILGIQNMKWNDFLDTLNVMSKIFKTRIPIIIDGLNESVYNGKFNPIWKSDLPTLINSIKKRNGLYLIILYRPAYEEHIFNDKENLIEWSTTLHDLKLIEIDKYLKYYKLDISIPYRLFQVLGKPLFLRIFCETYGNPDIETIVDKEIFSELQVIDIFKKFVQDENKNFNESLDLLPTSNKFIDSIKKVAKELWENLSRSILFDKFILLIEERILNEGWNQSISKKLLEKGLIFNRYIFEEEEYVLFTFDYFAGYLIAIWLVEKYSKKLRRKKIPRRVLKKLLKHPLSEDILYFLSVLIITEFGSYLNQILKNRFNLYYDLIGLYSVPKEKLNQSMLNYISSIYESIIKDDSLIPILFYNIFTPNHPLNINNFNNNLFRLRLPTRELYWTEYIRKNQIRFKELVVNYKETIRDPPLNSSESEILLLKTIFIALLLPTTIRDFRNIMTKVLFKYGIKFPEKFFKLASNLMENQDPYITERIIAILYGLTMFFFNQPNSEVNKDLIVNWAKKLNEWFFQEDSKYSTTHFFIRQHARFVIKLGLLIDSEILSKESIILTRPPYKTGGIRTWDEIALENIGPFKSGAYPFRLENFGKYIIGDLVPYDNSGLSDENEYNKLLRNIYWRMRDLGFSGISFSEIDKTISNLNNYYYPKSGIGKVDRYGKKFAWIAYFELAGYRLDQELIKEWKKDRLFEYFIDPSFPKPPRIIELKGVNLLKREEEDVNTRLDILEKFGDKNFLLRDELNEDQDDWILLNAIIYQSHERGQGQIVYRIDAAIFTSEINDTNFEEILDYVKNNNTYIKPDNMGVIYAGEVPWSDLFKPENQYDKILNLTRYYHLDTVEIGYSKETYMPSKDLCNYLKLKKKGRLFEFIDEKGEISVVACNIKSENNLKGLTIYIKRSLLELYVEEKKGVFFQNIKLVVNYLLDDAPTDLKFIPNEYRTHMEKYYLNLPLQEKRFYYSYET